MNRQESAKAVSNRHRIDDNTCVARKLSLDYVPAISTKRERKRERDSQTRLTGRLAGGKFLSLLSFSVIPEVNGATGLELNIHLNLNGDNRRASHDSDASNGSIRVNQSTLAHSSRSSFFCPRASTCCWREGCLHGEIEYLSRREITRKN